MCDSVDFWVTGFGPFCNVPRNPSEQLVERLAERGPNWRAHKFRLRVSAQAVDESVPTLFALAKARAAATSSPAVVLHVGVDASARSMVLERGAVNTKDFGRCADEDGYRPSGPERIDPGSPLDAYRPTDLPLDRVARELRDEGLDVELSPSGGTFVSNYVYWRSLELAGSGRLRVHALYVHVPPFRAMGPERQQRFLERLLRVLAESLCPRPS